MEQGDRPAPNRGEPKQVIVIRMKYPDADGKLRKLRFGKLAAQVAHASNATLLDRKIEFLDKDGELIPIRGVMLEPTKADIAEMTGSCSMPDAGNVVFEGDRVWPMMLLLTKPMDTWSRVRFKKIVLVADTEEQLVRIHELALERGLPTALIEDHGLTEFHGVKTKTAVGIGPAEPELIDEITGPDGLVPCRLA